MKIKSIIPLLGAVIVAATATGIPADGTDEVRYGFAPPNPVSNIGAIQLLRANAPSHIEPAETIPNIYGLVASADGPYVGTIPTSPDESFTKIYSNDKLQGTGGSVYVNEKLYVMVMTTEGVMNTTTMNVFRTKPSYKLLESKPGLPYNSSATCLTYDASTDQVYGQFYNDEISSMTWGVLDLNSGQSHVNKDMEDHLVAIAAHPDGRIFGINSMGMFMEIYKATGNVRRIGHTDIKPAYMQSAVIDQQTGRFYWAAYTDTGTSGLYEVNIETGSATLITPFAGNEEVVCLYMETPPVGDNVPASVSDVTLEFEGNSLTGNVRFKAPSQTAGGGSLAGELDAVVFMDGKTFSAKATPGKECTIPVTASGEGYHNFYIHTSNAEGAGPKIHRQKWLGDDTPQAVKGVTLQNNNGKAVLSWQPSAGGIHDGFVDPERLTYTIRRMPDNKVTEGVKGSTFTDEISSANMASIHYRIIPVYAGKRGDYTDSPDVLFGSHYTAPASIKFGDRGTFSTLTVVDGNSDGVTWQWYYGGAAQYKGNSAKGRKANDWIITPPVYLEPGNYYRITFPLYGKNARFFPQPYELWMGNGKDTASMTTLLVRDTLSEGSTTMQFLNRDVMVKVEKAGEYNFGFRTTTTALMDLYISGIGVEQACALTSAEAPLSMQATGAEKGTLRATVSMKAPTKTLEGKPLGHVQKIELYREKAEYLSGILVSQEWVPIHTFTSPSPGDSLSYEDNGAQQGTNRYKAVSYGDDGFRGEESTASCWCGVDIPTAPTTVTLTENPGTGKCTLTWDTPQTGANGGYIDPAGLVYSIIEPQYGNTLGTTTGNSVTIQTPETENLQYLVRLLVGVTNIAGNSSSVTASNGVIIGCPYALPVVEDFPRRNYNYPWFTDGHATDDGGWATSQGNGLYGDSGYARFNGLIDDEMRLISSKISLKGSNNPTLRFFVASQYPQLGEFTVEVSDSYDGNYTVLDTLRAPAGGWPVWTPIEIPLSAFKDRDYIHIAFHIKAIGMDCNFAIDNITVRDVLPHDLEVSRLGSDREEVKVSREGKVALQAVIENRGTQPVAGNQYSIVLASGDRDITTLAGVDLQPYERQAISYGWIPTLNDDSISDISVRAVWDHDMDMTNNIAEGVSLLLRKPFAPPVKSLTGQETPSGMALSWQQPDLSGQPVEYVTDSFEQYRNQSIDHAGDWTIHDRDSLPTTTAGYYFDMMGMPMGYIVMNTDRIKYDTETWLSTRWPAHSGSTFMAAFASVGGDNDDWLVTPLLSGNAQQIRFWAMSAMEEYGHEAMDVLYSTTGTDPEDFVRLTDKTVMVPSQWTEYMFALPEGARYCAVRCTSHNRMGLFIDDFTYESAARPLIPIFIGYNVYRGMERMNAEPLTTTSYTAPAGAAGDYTVRTVYDLGESAPSQVISYSGVNGIETDTEGEERWYDLQGHRIQKPVRPGIYIRNGKKIVVKPSLR